MARIFLSTLTLVFFFSFSAFTYTFIPEKGLVFEFKDHLNTPLYKWPKTLISYTVDFAGNISEEELVLINNKNKETVPFQLSEVKNKDGNLLKAKINFITDLKSGDFYSYQLAVNLPNSKSDKTKAVTVKNDKGFLQISSSKLSVKVPTSQAINKNNAPATIFSVRENKKWIGKNQLISPERKIKSINTKIVEEGKLFVKVKVSYELEGEAAYQTQLSVVKGYPFVILEEEMVNIPKDENVKVSYSWSNFHPQYRWANRWGQYSKKNEEAGLGINTPRHLTYMQEDPHWTGLNWIEDPSKDMHFFLIPIAGNGIREQTTHASFWEEKGSELGVFIYDFNKWKSPDYGIWQSSQDLAVKFRFTNDTLYWKYPINTGTRSTAVLLMKVDDSEKIRDDFKQDFDDSKIGTNRRGGDKFLIRSAQVLKQKYSTFNLNKVKSWVLQYDITKKRPKNPFGKPRNSKTPQHHYDEVYKGPFHRYMIGVNNFIGSHSIDHRLVYEHLVEDYLNVYSQLPEKQRKQVEALFLLSAYINTQEDMNSVRHALMGTPNMAADGWCVPAQASFLFPEHPMAKEWLDFYQKEIELYGLFYTRPEIKSYQAKGGRWTESLPVYNWAYMRPTSFSNIAGTLVDGKNRWATPHWVPRGQWQVDQLTAPVYSGHDQKLGLRGRLHDFSEIKASPEGWKTGDSLSFDLGFERYYTSHGAHGPGTIVPVYLYNTELANRLKYYAPLTAEYLFWTNSVSKEIKFEDKPNHSNWDKVSRLGLEKNRGTNPHLKTSKYTGQGLILRAGVGENDEVSLHLDQIDKGPNYRYGNQAQGGTGSLYFYAGGRIYNGHDHEANGDYNQNNTDYVTNFGFMKNGSYTNIGPNELKAPLYDLDVVQFGELLSNDKQDRHSWPEYNSRSALLVGTDYFLLYDKAGTYWRAFNRFSWFIGKEYQYPQIYFLNTDGRGRFTVAETKSSQGFYRDGQGSNITLVAPIDKKIDVQGVRKNVPHLLKKYPIYETKTDRSKKFPDGIFAVKTNETVDIIFRNEEDTDYSNDTLSLKGKTGVIRYYQNGNQELALIKGTQIATSKLNFEFSENKLGWSATIQSKEIFGKAKVIAPITLKIKGKVLKGRKFYINGKSVKCKKIQGGIELKLPKGDFYWELSNKGGTPLAPIITHTEYETNGVSVLFSNPSNIDYTSLELSEDGGKTWKRVSQKIEGSKAFVKAIPNIKKVHVRLIALGKYKNSKPSADYPIYFETKKPHYPEGLATKLGNNKVDLSWGKVLGAKQYKLYRRKKGELAFNLIYQGLNQTYTDRSCTGVIPAFPLPGLLDNLDKDTGRFVIYEYAIATENGHGEGDKSQIVSTDPRSWLNWYPDVELKFRRQSAYWRPPYVYKNMVPPLYYPE